MRRIFTARQHSFCVIISVSLYKIGWIGGVSDEKIA